MLGRELPEPRLVRTIYIASPAKLVIGPDIELTFFALGWRLVREKTDLCPFFCQICSELCLGPLRQLPGVLQPTAAVADPDFFVIKIPSAEMVGMVLEHVTYARTNEPS